MVSLMAQPAPAKEWDKSLGGNDFDALYSARQTADGGYILGGTSYSIASGDKTEDVMGGSTPGVTNRQDYWVVKLDASGVKMWDKTFGGDSFDNFRALLQLPDGGYLIGGQSQSNASGNKTENSKGGPDFWIIRLDATGSKIWDKTVGSTGDDDLRSIQLTTDAGFILGGISSANAGGDKSENSKGEGDFWIIKINASGNKEWDKTIGGSGFDGLSSIQQIADGGYLVGGESYSNAGGDKTENSKGNSDFWLVKLDASGNKEWDKTIGGSGYDGLNSVYQTIDGGYVLGGTSSSSIGGDKSENPKGSFTGSRDFWIVKLDADRNKVWDRTIGTTGGIQGFTMNQTEDGGYILGTTAYSGAGNDKSEGSRGNADYWVVKLNADGHKEWDKTFGGTGYDFMTSAQQTTDGGYIFGGYSDSPVSGEKGGNSKGSYDYWIIKLEGESCPIPAVPVISQVSASVDPVQVNTTFAVTGTTTDNNLSAAIWNWGDGQTASGTISSSTINGTHTYTTPGVYTITLAVENTCGETIQNTYQYAVVYDPSAGFITGGGWINSPPGAYVPNPTLTGKANFGLVSKYKKGATVPEGNTQFEFKAGTLNFHSTSYEWLVIAGAKAQFKGKGTINGSGNYSFMLTAIDGQVNGGSGTDKFRIRIWDNTSTVYDNNIGSTEGTADNAVPSTTISGGAIMIQNGGNRNAREGIGNEYITPSDYIKLSNYPNPGNGKITFEFMLPQGGEYQLDLMDARGNRVQHLKHGTVQAGEYLRVPLEQGQMPKGLYITRLITAYGVKSVKLLVE
ncbi:hypothetical protein GCM10027291_04810 [Telluribacter humicola]